MLSRSVIVSTVAKLDSVGSRTIKPALDTTSRLDLSDVASVAITGKLSTSAKIANTAHRSGLSLSVMTWRSAGTATG